MKGFSPDRFYFDDAIERVVALSVPALPVRRVELARGSTSRLALRAVLVPQEFPQCVALRFRGHDGMESIRVSLASRR